MLIHRAFAATLDGALSPMVGPGYVLLSKQFGVSVDDVASSFGSILLGLGCFMCFYIFWECLDCFGLILCYAGFSKEHWL